MEALGYLVPAAPSGWWAIVAVVLLGAELLLPGFFLVWLGAAAAAVALLLLLFDLGLGGQLLLFAALGLAGIVGSWRFYRASMKPQDQGALRPPDEQMIGRLGRVAEPIRHGAGKVRIGDTLWLAEGPDLEAGADIKVVGQRGTVMLVERN